MAKWKSPLFSDIRNKLGENVVFSMWKGRPYMREYVIPANPDTLAQQANRLHMAAIIEMYQSNVKGNAAHKAAWNVAALPKTISGYNLFCQYGRTDGLGAVTLAAATFSVEILASAIPSDRLAMILDDGGVLILSTKRGLGTYTTADFPSNTPSAGDKLYVCDAKILSGTDTESDAKLYKCVNHWKPNEATGALEALVLT